MNYLLLLAFLLVVTTTAYSQASASPPQRGRHFIVAFPDTTRSYAPTAERGTFPPTDARLIFFSDDTANVTVKGMGYGRAVQVLPSASTVLSLYDDMARAPAVFMDELEEPTARTFDIRSDRPIIVYCYYLTDYGSEAFTPLPVENWGADYFAMGFPAAPVYDVDPQGKHEEGVSESDAPAQLLVIAAEDNTEVTIASPVPLTGPSTRTITLHAGYAYQVETEKPSVAFSQRYDLSGTKITATKPIGVISGNTRSEVLGGGVFLDGVFMLPLNTLRNSTVEWLWPTRLHGRTFAYRRIARFDDDLSDEIVRLYATSPGATRVMKDDGAWVDLRQGEFVTYHSAPYATDTGIGRPTQAPFVLTSDRPAQAVVLSGPFWQNKTQPGNLFPEGDTWSSALASLAPREQWYTSARFHSPTTPMFLTHWVTIVAERSASVELDGKPVKLTPFPMDGMFAHGRVEIKSGDHHIISREGKFSAIAYGNSDGYEAYRPARVNDDKRGAASSLGAGKSDGAMPAHVSQYYEIMSITYAYPVSGETRISVERDDECRFSEVVVSNLDRGRAGPFRVEQDSISNSDVEIVIGQSDTTDIVVYRIRFMPENTDSAAHALVRIIGTDTVITIPYRYDPKLLKANPNPVDLKGVPVDVGVEVKMSLKNENLGAITIRSVRLAHYAGARGGFRVISLPPEGAFEAGRTVSFAVSFIGAAGDSLYTDSLVVETDCGTLYVPLRATTAKGKAPYPDIGGNDWGDRWLTTLNACVKNGAAHYAALIPIRNLGSLDFTVRLVELIGDDADAGFFRLDNSDPATTVMPGAVVAPASIGDTPTVRQKVLFLPEDERGYSCLIRLTTDDERVVEGVLVGGGIESHLEIGEYDFGVVLLRSVGGATVSGRLPLVARPTRSLTIHGLRLGGVDSTSFRFAADFIDTLPTSSKPWLVHSGDTVWLRVEYTPGGVGESTATIEAVGDHSRCDDSVGVLRGEARGLQATGVDFGSVLSCSSPSGLVSITNPLNEAVQVVSISVVDPLGAFTVALPGVPYRLEGGGMLQMPVRFIASAVGAYTATVTLRVRSLDGSTDYGDYIAKLIAEVPDTKIMAHIDRGLSAQPGRRLIVPVRLDAPLDAAGVDTLRFAVRYNPRLMRLVGTRLRNTLLDGWTLVEVSNVRGEYVMNLAGPLDSPLKGIGTLLELEFLMFIGDSLASDLPFTLETPQRPCLTADVKPGRVSIDSLCGLPLRLMAVTASGYALDQSHPNPFNPETEIGFELGLDGETSLVIYNSVGEEIVRPVNDVLGAGRYSVRWNADAYPSGLYYYRLTSGGWTRTRTMMLVK